MMDIVSEKKFIRGMLNDSLCMDCVFWYQCRQGKVDCHIKAATPVKNAVGA